MRGAECPHRRSRTSFSLSNSTTRAAALAAKNFASKQQLDESTAALHKAEAGLELAAADSTRRTRPDPTKEERAIADAKVALAEAAGADLEAKLAKTTLVAPTDGVIGLMVAELGEMIAPGQSVMTMTPGTNAGSPSRSERTVSTASPSGEAKIALRTARGPHRGARHGTAASRRIRGLARGPRGRRPRPQQLSPPRRPYRRGTGAGAGNDRVGGAQGRCFAIGHASSLVTLEAWRRIISGARHLRDECVRLPSAWRSPLDAAD